MELAELRRLFTRLAEDRDGLQQVFDTLKDGIIIIGENGVPYVVDFIKTDFIDFPYFNIADSAICVGAVIFFVFVLFFSDKEPLFPQRKKDAEK